MSTKDVFISHSAKDRDVAQDICALLEGHGLSCWIAPRDVTPGKNFAEEILDAIEETRATVLVLSEHSNASVHVRHEVERAVSKGRIVFPVRIQEVQPARALELFISSAQWIDAWTPPLETAMDRLAHALKTMLAAARGEAPPPPPPPSAKPSTRRAQSNVAAGRHTAAEPQRRSSALGWAAVAALVLAVAGGGVWWRSMQTSEPGIVLEVDEPRGAEILVDGRLVGQSTGTARTIALAEGTHTLKVQADGFWPYEQTIDVKGAAPEALRVKLTRSNSLAVAVTPTTAKVSINGKTVDRPFPIELRDGRHTIDVSAPGYEPYRHTVELDGGRRESLVVNLNATAKRADGNSRPRHERAANDESAVRREAEARARAEERAEARAEQAAEREQRAAEQRAAQERAAQPRSFGDSFGESFGRGLGESMGRNLGSGHRFP